MSDSSIYIDAIRKTKGYQTMKFTKMQGAGNDYIYVNCFEEKVADPNTTAVKVSDRHFGIEIGRASCRERV